MDSVVKYFSTEEIKLAIAIAVNKHGLESQLPHSENKYETPDDGILAVDSSSPESETESVTAMGSRSSSKVSVVEDEDFILGEIFNTPDIESTKKPSSTFFVSKEQFTKTLLSLKGLLSMVQQCKTSKDCLHFLNNGLNKHEDEETEQHPVFLVMSFVNQQMMSPNKDEENNDSLLSWIKDAVKTVIEIVNIKIDHEFVVDSCVIMQEFLNHSLSSLTEVNNSTKDISISIIALMSHNKSFGKQTILFIIEKYVEVSDKLRAADKFGYETDVMNSFEVFMNLLLETWPLYISEICPNISVSTVSKRKENIPTKNKLSLKETTDLTKEVIEWRSLLDQCTVGLTVMHPDFCHAVWRFDQFCQGLLKNLTRR